MKMIRTIWFDWPNRVWKWTQITYLSDIIANNIENLVYIVRWDWTRMWKWNIVTGENKNIIIFDPNSEYRKNCYIDLKKKLNNWIIDIEWRREASNRINRELYLLLNYSLPKLQSKTSKQIYLLLDRGLVSRQFFELQREEKIRIPISELLKFKQWKSNKNNYKVIPEISFLLNTNKETLIKRIDFEQLQWEQWKFRKKVIEDYYEIFQFASKSINTYFPKVYEIFDNWECSKEYIHNQILNILKEENFI